MELTQNARTVLERRYLAKGEDNKPKETVEGLFTRVSSAIAAVDEKYSEGSGKITREEFARLIESLDFLPNSPTLMNAGRDLGQLSACFVLPVADSMEDIFEAIKQAALIHKSGGGTGFSFSRLRPKGSTVNSTGGVASGPISFMKVFNTATEAVKQGGTRRGANMGILRVDHPDILEFIDCKKDSTEITNFNISVGVTEAFMRAVEKDEEYELVDPKGKLVTGTLKAREVFEKIVENAWKNGEPGIIFLDRLNRDNVVPLQGEIESTNPCGEQPLLPYESCNLGSINLVNMFKDGGVDWEKLGKTVDSSVHFLDNVIEANRFPLEMIRETTLATRKIGLGVMGWSDLLLLLGIPYNSDEAVELAERLMGFITERGREMSEKLAVTRGAFPLFDESVYAGGTPVRNATITTIAPTGTLSIIAGVSSGIEPVFAYAYCRNVMDNTKLIEVNPILKRVLGERGLYTDGLMEKIVESGTLAHIDEMPDDIKRIFVCAHDISPEWHIRMQAAFQRHTDNAVSKTVNFPSDATIEDVAEVFSLAFKLDCKGVTIYRDGSRDSQVLNIGHEKQETVAEAVPATTKISPRPRPDVTTGFTEKIKVGCGNLYITVNYDENGLCEVFTNTGRHGGCPSQSEATSRLVSIALRAGMDVDSIVEQLRGIRCASTIRQPGMNVLSCPDAIAKVIAKVKNHAESGNGYFVPDGSGVEKDIPSGARLCPECSHELESDGGCIICRNCGYSKCN